MANVKSRVNTTKAASTKINTKGKVGRPRKSLTNVQNVTGKEVVQRQRRGKVKKKPEKKVTICRLNTTQEENKSNEYKKPSLKKLLTTSGRIRQKTKIGIKLFNELLKNELQIKASDLLPKKEVYKNTRLNNNETKVRKRSKAGNQKGNNQNNRQSDSSEKSKANVEPGQDLNSETSTPLKVFQCDHCNKKFKTKPAIKRHLSIHDKLTSYSCSQCNKYFSNHIYLAAHAKRQHPNWNIHFMCNICDKAFLLKSNLKHHLACHSRNEKMFKCIYCKEKYYEQHSLIEHEKQHLVDGKYLCIVCEMGFDCRNRLTSHYRVHLKVKDFMCQHCGKEFLRMNSVRRHVQICHSGHRIQCKICKKYLKGHLAEHMRTHEKNRPHECPDCGQRFTQSTQLTVHRRSHSGTRPYTCRICKRPFTHSNALMLHIRRHTGEKPFACAMCPLNFSQLPHMKAHMRNIHGKENPYRCQKCKQFFKLKADLADHTKNCNTDQKSAKSSQKGESEEESATRLTRMRFLLALLLTMIATKEKLKYLGFNKRLIDELLVESLEAMGHKPCKDFALTPFNRLKTNIEILLEGTVPKEQMEKLKKENKTTEQILELLTDEKKRS
ncbi:zinc finger protein 2-like [Zerene cesonia]|uniref:zinc finger protein 2-like n=1 Tax=Zerene cesonia TaxID=33412 RepID=UPI0018E53924|nr:zinc finger protein 2-like [Zerene cesonia]